MIPEPNIQKTFRECLSGECTHHIRIIAYQTTVYIRIPCGAVKKAYADSWVRPQPRPSESKSLG